MWNIYKAVQQNQRNFFASMLCTIYSLMISFLLNNQLNLEDSELNQNFQKRLQIVLKEWRKSRPIPIEKYLDYNNSFVRIIIVDLKVILLDKGILCEIVKLNDSLINWWITQTKDLNHKIQKYTKITMKLRLLKKADNWLFELKITKVKNHASEYCRQLARKGPFVFKPINWITK